MKRFFMCKICNFNLMTQSQQQWAGKWTTDASVESPLSTANQQLFNTFALCSAQKRLLTQVQVFSFFFFGDTCRVRGRRVKMDYSLTRQNTFTFNCRKHKSSSNSSYDFDTIKTKERLWVNSILSSWDSLYEDTTGEKYGERVSEGKVKIEEIQLVNVAESFCAVNTSVRDWKLFFHHTHSSRQISTRREKRARERRKMSFRLNRVMTWACIQSKWTLNVRWRKA